MALIRRNLASLGICSEATVFTLGAHRALEKLVGRQKREVARFDFIFLDPPYAAAKDYSRVLEFLGSADLLASSGIVVAEHRRSFALPEVAGALLRYRVLKQGDAALSFYRRVAAVAGENSSAE